MSSDDLAVVRDKNRIVKAKARDRCCDLLDLILAVTARVARVQRTKTGSIAGPECCMSAASCAAASEAVWRTCARLAPPSGFFLSD